MKREEILALCTSNLEVIACIRALDLKLQNSLNYFLLIFPTLIFVT